MRNNLHQLESYISRSGS